MKKRKKKVTKRVSATVAAQKMQLALATSALVSVNRKLTEIHQIMVEIKTAVGVTAEPVNPNLMDDEPFYSYKLEQLT